MDDRSAVYTLGIDLSAKAEKTACCVLESGRDTAHVVHLEERYDDPALLVLAARYEPSKIAIDSPFGWPLAFIRTVSRFTETGEWPDSDDRRPLLFRQTDLVVRELTGTDPLSVSSNLLAICAMRCARLLTLLADGEPLDRTGGGRAAEVYPAAALRQWGLDPRGYKGTSPEKASKRMSLVSSFALATASWLKLEPSTVEELNRSDHLFDALVSAVVGRAIESGLTLPIPAELRHAASAEGWIHLPKRERLDDFDPLNGLNQG